MTYRQLLEAVERAESLQATISRLANHPNRFKGTIEERDDAETSLANANRLFDKEIIW